MIKETTLTIEEIENILVGRPDSPFYIRKNIVIPNVDWGYLNHEADLLVLSKNKHLTEIEIKRTWSDFMADFKKKHTHVDPKIYHFYYAVPKSIGEKCFRFLYDAEWDNKRYCLRGHDSAYTEHSISNHCGLIIYSDDPKDPDFYCKPYSIAMYAYRMNDDIYYLDEKEELKLLRLLGMRVWNLKKKVVKFQEKERKTETKKTLKKDDQELVIIDK